MKLNNIFSSHMVFAKGKPVRIYGEGKGSAKITFAGTTKTVESDSDKWLVEFPAMDFGGPYDLVAEFENETVSLCDIYIGKVFLMAGQSNMQFKISESTYDPKEHECSDLVRFYCTDRKEKSERFTPVDGWVKCTKENAKDFSCIGYIVSQIISKRDGIAVGIVCCYQGASVIESWLPEGTYEKLGIQMPIEEKHIVHTEPLFIAWNHDGDLYNYAFSQVVPFSFSAVAWYQGESDASPSEAKVYDTALCGLIDLWRDDLGDKELNFVIVQIADFEKEMSEGEGWAGIQAAQERAAAKRDHTYLVVSKDVCDTKNIHPADKNILSERIAAIL